MPDTIQAEIQAFHEGFRDLVRHDMGDGSSKVLRAYVDGPRYDVLHLKGEEAATVFSTGYADEAAGAYRAFELLAHHWHPAYLPRGISWPTKDKLLFHVYAAGSTIEDCVKGFLVRTGDTLKEGSLAEVQPDDTSKPHEWSVAFVSEESGTGFKAVGVNVPGGVVMTWWS